MDGSNIYDGCHDMLALLENSKNPFWTPPSSSSLQETMMMNFDQEPQLGVPSSPKRNRIDRSILRSSNIEDIIGEEELDLNAYNQSDKKRRLTQAQVKSLEKSFEVENKLEPERKVELAKQLGLQPRQVAIWFQNRRARYKSKQIEKEYDTLKANYDRLKEDYASLCKEKMNLENKVEFWKSKFEEKERNETNSNLDILVQLDEGITNIGTRGKVDETGAERVVIPSTKQSEDVSSAKSDIFDSESPHCTGGNQSSALPVEASSTLMRDLDQQSDFSQDDEEHLMINNNLLLPQTPPTFNNFLKVPEDVIYDPNVNSCNFSLVDDQPAMWPWLY